MTETERGSEVQETSWDTRPRSVSVYWGEDVARDARRDWFKYERPDASTPEEEWLRQAQDAERGKTVSIWRRPRA